MTKASTPPYTLPTQTPFSYNVGICFHTNMCNWYVSPTVKFSRPNQIQYSQDRLAEIVKTFKLIRVYGFRVAGFPSNSDLDPCTQALVNVMNTNSEVEAVISMNPGMKTYLLTDSQATDYFKEFSTQLGSNTGQVKALLLGNEVNANGYTHTDLTNMITAIKANAEYKKLNYPLSVSFSSLPDQSGNDASDKMVKAIVDGWDPSWNGGNPFVFIDPYPDAAGIGSAAGVYEWQAKVQAYYATLHPTLQIFIGETGAEGDATDKKSVPVIKDILTELDTQESAKASKGYTVPTFIFEALDEPLKPGPTVQTNMGVYKDAAAADGSTISIKSGITVKGWVSKKIGS
ncbi:MAG: hypothetical protein HEP71_05235 [Roseivirga sp.]|nr:hypothetical protein [Roseivirga sp.]